jgi:hypothetical protein
MRWFVGGETTLAEAMADDRREDTPPEDSDEHP